MKSIIYVGVLLMAGAAVYGFVDYKKTSSDEKFKQLYEHKKTVQEEKLNADPGVEVLSGARKEVLVDNKKTVKPTREITKSDKKKDNPKPKISYKEFSRAAMEQFEPPVVVDTAEVEIRD